MRCDPATVPREEGDAHSFAIRGVQRDARGTEFSAGALCRCFWLYSNALRASVEANCGDKEGKWEIGLPPMRIVYNF